MGDVIVLHEAGPACDHDVLDIWPWLKLGGANEHGGFSPDAIVLEEAVWLAEAFGEVRFRVSDIAVVKSFFLFHFFSLFSPFPLVRHGHTHHSQPHLVTLLLPKRSWLAKRARYRKVWMRFSLCVIPGYPVQESEYSWCCCELFTSSASGLHELTGSWRHLSAPSLLSNKCTQVVWTMSKHGNHTEGGQKRQ